MKTGFLRKNLNFQVSEGGLFGFFDMLQPALLRPFGGPPDFPAASRPDPLAHPRFREASDRKGVRDRVTDSCLRHVPGKGGSVPRTGILGPNTCFSGVGRNGKQVAWQGRGQSRGHPTKRRRIGGRSPCPHEKPSSLERSMKFYIVLCKGIFFEKEGLRHCVMSKPKVSCARCYCVSGKTLATPAKLRIMKTFHCVWAQNSIVVTDPRRILLLRPPPSARTSVAGPQRWW